MKKIVLRLIGAVCIILAAVIMVCLPILSLEGVSSKDLRQERRNTLNDLEKVEDFVLGALEGEFGEFEYIDLAEELDDNDLPHTKGTIKKKFSDVEKAIRIIYSDKFSVKDGLELCAWLPTFMTDVDNFLAMDDEVINMFVETSEYVNREDIEEILDGASEIEGFLTVPIILVSVFGVCILFVAVVQILGKWKATKWVLAIVFVAVAVLLMVGVPMISSSITEMAEDASSVLEGMSFKATLVPVFAALLTIVPVVLDFFIKDKKKKQETENEEHAAVTAE